MKAKVRSGEKRGRESSGGGLASKPSPRHVWDELLCLLLCGVKGKMKL